MKRLSLAVVILLTLFLAVCVAGLAQEKQATVPAEPVNTTIAKAQGMLVAEKESLRSIPPPGTVAEQRLILTVTHELKLAERSIGGAIRANNKGDGKTALKRAQQAIAILENARKLINHE